MKSVFHICDATIATLNILNDCDAPDLHPSCNRIIRSLRTMEGHMLVWRSSSDPERKRVRAIVRRSMRRLTPRFDELIDELWDEYCYLSDRPASDPEYVIPRVAWQIKGLHDVLTVLRCSLANEVYDWWRGG